MTSTSYVKEALRNLKVEMDKAGVRLVGKPSTPMQSGKPYH